MSAPEEKADLLLRTVRRFVTTAADAKKAVLVWCQLTRYQFTHRSSVLRGNYGVGLSYEGTISMLSHDLPMRETTLGRLLKALCAAKLAVFSPGKLRGGWRSVPPGSTTLERGNEWRGVNDPTAWEAAQWIRPRDLSEAKI